MNLLRGWSATATTTATHVELSSRVIPMVQTCTNRYNPIGLILLMLVVVFGLSD